MIYGYVNQTLNDSSGLAELREVSFAVDPATLRSLADFLLSAADELELEPRSVHWHLHVPDNLRESLGCDVIVLAPEDDNCADDVLPYVAE